MKLLLALLFTFSTCAAQTYHHLSIDDGKTIDYYSHDVVLSRSKDSVVFTGPTYKYTYVLIRNNTYTEVSSIGQKSIAFITFGDTVTICQVYSGFYLVSKLYR